MRLPFDITGPKFQEEARVKFSFHSPELNQNIEISIDGDKTSVETLCDAFQRFLGALGIGFPENVVVGLIELDEDELIQDEIEGLIDDEDDEDDEDEDDNDDKPGNKNKKRK